MGPPFSEKDATAIRIFSRDILPFTLFLYFCVCYFVAVTCGRHGKRISRFAVATEFHILITFMSFSQTGVLHKRFTRWDAGCR